MKKLESIKKTAISLVDSGRNKPKRSDLRRGVGVACYAIFHTLTKCCADLLAGSFRLAELNIIKFKASSVKGRHTFAVFNSIFFANPALSARSLIYPSQLRSCDGYIKIAAFRMILFKLPPGQFA